jgi:hypothetical protein
MTIAAFLLHRDAFKLSLSLLVSSSSTTFPFNRALICLEIAKEVTYDHRLMRIGHRVRSAIHKHQIGRLVVGWVTTSEYLLSHVFCFWGFPFWPRFGGVLL